MKISHLGAKDYITGPCHQIETDSGSADSVNILVNCGTAYGNDPELPFSLSHAPRGNTSLTAPQSVERCNASTRRFPCNL